VDKTVLEISAIEIAVNDLLEVGTEESVSPFKSFLVDPDEGFQMILDTAIIIAILWIEGLICDCCGGHDSSPTRKSFYLPRSLLSINDRP
jgi:hypothetical protein